MSNNIRKIVIPKLANEYGVDKRSTKILQSSLNIVIRILDFIAQKNSLSSCVRSGKDARNFICSTAMNNSSAIGAPVITVNKARCNRPGVFNIFLGMSSIMVAWRNIFTTTMRTVVKVKVSGFIGLFSFSAESSSMTNWIVTLIRGSCSFFAFIFSKRIFESIRKLCFSLRVSIFTFFNSLLKFKSLDDCRDLWQIQVCQTVC